MSSRRTVCSFWLAPLLTLAMGSSLASSQGDALISKVYMEETFINLMKQVIKEGVNTSLNESYQSKLQELQSLKSAHSGASASNASLASLEAGVTMNLAQGSVFTPLEGELVLDISGTLVDLTLGTEVQSVLAEQGHQYLVAEDSVVRVGGGLAAVQLSVLGEYSLDDNGAGGEFLDVSSGDWYYTAVEFVKEHSLFSGTSPNYFSPEITMDRSMMMTVLYRLAGSPQEEMDSATMSFSDVSTEHWYEPYVRWGGTQQLVGGMGEDYFGAQYRVTRQQVAVMLYAFSQQYLGLDMTHTTSLEMFQDHESVAYWAVNQMSWMISRGLFYGIPDSSTLLKGEAYASRSEVAQMLMNYYQYIEYIGAI